MIKRDLEVKDTSRFFGAHGGVLDRLDAVFFTMVVGYYAAVALGYGWARSPVKRLTDSYQSPPSRGCGETTPKTPASQKLTTRRVHPCVPLETHGAQTTTHPTP